MMIQFPNSSDLVVVPLPLWGRRARCWCGCTAVPPIAAARDRCAISNIAYEMLKNVLIPNGNAVRSTCTICCPQRGLLVGTCGQAGAHLRGADARVDGDRQERR